MISAARNKALATQARRIYLDALLRGLNGVGQVLNQSANNLLLQPAEYAVMVARRDGVHTWSQYGARWITGLTSALRQAAAHSMSEPSRFMTGGIETSSGKLSLVGDEFVSEDNWPALLPESVDAVIDACDQIRAKAAMAAWALKSKTLFVSIGAAGGKRLAHLVEVADLSQTTHDPLLAQLRYRLRKFHGAPKEGKKIGTLCVFSKEPVAPPHASCAIGEDGDGSLNCHGYGSVVTVTSTFGMCAAGVVLDRLAGK